MVKSNKEALSADGAASAPAPETPKRVRNPDKTKANGKPRKKPLRSQAAVEKAAKLAENQAEALRMRRNGTPYREIAEVFDIAVSTCYTWVRNAIAAIPQEEATEVRTMMLDRWDTLTAKLMDALDDIDGVPPLDLINQILAIDARRAKLLGMDFSDRMMAEAAAQNAKTYGKVGDAYGDMLKADVPTLRPDAPIPPQPVL